MNKRQFMAYVAGPYRAPTVWGIKENIRRAEEAATRLWQMGYTVFCPHLNTAFFDGLCPDEVWLEGDLVVLRRCDFLVLLEGWKNSHGASNEVSEARRLDMPVMEYAYFDSDVLNKALSKRPKTTTFAQMGFEWDDLLVTAAVSRKEEPLCVHENIVTDSEDDEEEYCRKAREALNRLDQARYQHWDGVSEDLITVVEAARRFLEDKGHA